MSSAAWNVAIVGAGPAGCATALALARAGVERVCVIDPDRRPGLQIGETLPPDVRLVLDRLGLWEDFVAQEHEPCLGSCSAWGDEALGYNDFVLNTYGRGWHLDRHRFNDLLRAAAGSCGAAFISGAKLLGVGPQAGPLYELKLKQKDGGLAGLRARYVVDASGTRAALACQMGAQRVFVDRLAFVYGFFEAGPGASTTQLTMLEAAEDGWWYAVGLPDGRVAVAFATEPQTVRALGLSLERRWFARVLRTQHIAPRLDQCRFLQGTLVIRGAPSFLLDRAAGPGWLAVGDAAATYDPLRIAGPLQGYGRWPRGRGHDRGRARLRRRAQRELRFVGRSVVHRLPGELQPLLPLGETVERIAVLAAPGRALGAAAAATAAITKSAREGERQMSAQTPQGRPTIGRTAALVYGIVCYLIHWATFVYMMGFLINSFVPRTIDVGSTQLDTAARVVVNIVAIAVFVVLHWVMARDWFKQWWTRIVPEPIERSTYVLISSAALGALFLVWQPLTYVVWSVDAPAAAVALTVVYWLGWALAIYATFPIDHFDLFGVRQVVSYWKREPYKGPVGYDSLVYKLLPHPIFIGYAIIVWATPHMSAGHLLLAVILTLFLIVDVRLAEQAQPRAAT